MEISVAPEAEGIFVKMAILSLNLCRCKWHSVGLNKSSENVCTKQTLPYGKPTVQDYAQDARRLDELSSFCCATITRRWNVLDIFKGICLASVFFWHNKHCCKSQRTERAYFLFKWLWAFWFWSERRYKKRRIEKQKSPIYHFFSRGLEYFSCSSGALKTIIISHKERQKNNGDQSFLQKGIICTPFDQKAQVV